MNAHLYKRPYSKFCVAIPPLLLLSIRFKITLMAVIHFAYIKGNIIQGLTFNRGYAKRIWALPWFQNLTFRWTFFLKIGTRAARVTRLSLKSTSFHTFYITTPLCIVKLMFPSPGIMRLLYKESYITSHKSRRSISKQQRTTIYMLNIGW